MTYEDDRAAISVEASGDRAVAAGRDIGFVATGDVSIIAAVPFAKPVDVSLASHLVNLPSTNKTFVGREALLSQLDGSVMRESEALVQVIHGLGGVGKSALASHWANSRRNDTRLIWWITADVPSRIHAGLADLALSLHPPLSKQIDRELLSEWAIQWLASHREWLLILDNVAEPSLVYGLISRVSSQGRVLITSRRSTGWYKSARAISLDPLDIDESIVLFRQVTGGCLPEEGAIEVCRELGFLPLAIEQAAAFCVETATPPAHYLELLRQYPAKMYESGPEGGDSERTIARIWKISLERLRDFPVAGRILRTIAWLSPDECPRSALSELADPPDLVRGIGKLCAHSLISSDSATGLVSVHRLVQAVVRSEAESLNYLDVALKSLRYAAPHDPQHDPNGWPEWRILAPHVNAAVEHAITLGGRDRLERVRSLLMLLGTFYISQSDFRECVRCATQALEIEEELYGADSEELLGSLRALYMYHQDLGNQRLSREFLDRAIGIARQVHGDAGEEMVSLMADLSEQLRWQGKGDQALIQAKKSFRAGTRILPPKHRTWVKVLRELGETYCTNRRPREGLPYLKKALALTEELDSPNHPHAATMLRSLAWCFRTAFEREDALAAAVRGLEIVTDAYGLDHPVVVRFTRDVARTYRHFGDYAEAREVAILCIEGPGFALTSTDDQFSLLLGAAEDSFHLGDARGELEFLAFALELSRADVGVTAHSLAIEQRVCRILLDLEEFPEALEALLRLKGSSSREGSNSAELYDWAECEIRKLADVDNVLDGDFTLSVDIANFVGQSGPYVAAALSAYGAGVLTRAEAGAVEATANVGRRLLQAVWKRQGERDRVQLETAVQEAVDEPGDADAAAALRQLIKRALREDEDLLREVVGLVPDGGGSIVASGERSVAAGRDIGIAVTGDVRPACE
ncbi:FxSxx-COOH system tetratricopeptide repeat protein [Streptomyces griseofuscus]|uniref:FxSxx-COOH system tetratricopeptide repeat protein n=1 Tax=Streptomyces griseofuscus TaxID=146922 RepID=UPI0036AE7499